MARNGNVVLTVGTAVNISQIFHIWCLQEVWFTPGGVYSLSSSLLLCKVLSANVIPWILSVHQHCVLSTKIV